MGLEANCTARWKGQTGEGKLQFEGTELLFRGPFRLKLPVTGAGVEAREGQLVVTTEEGEAAFELGEKVAAKWAEKIRNPKELLDKLGVKAGMRVATEGEFEEGFLTQLRERGVEMAAAKGADVLFGACESKGDLKRMRAWGSAIRREGMVWVVYPKGRREITEMDVIRAIRSAGLVDMKVCRFSATHTALKAMLPLAAR
jgi:hypothetical protein